MDIYDRLYTVTTSLADKYRELALIESTEHRSKIEAWHNSNEETLKGRDRVADFSALSFTLDIIQLKGEIKALELEYDYIKILIDRGKVNADR